MSLKAVTAQNMFSDPVEIHDGIVTLVAQGTFSATVTVQIRYATDVAGAAWADANTGWTDFATTLTAAGVLCTELLAGAWQVRAGVKTGGYTSGTANLFVQSGRGYGA